MRGKVSEIASSNRLALTSSLAAVGGNAPCYIADTVANVGHDAITDIVDNVGSDTFPGIVRQRWLQR